MDRTAVSLVLLIALGAGAECADRSSAGAETPPTVAREAQSGKPENGAWGIDLTAMNLDAWYEAFGVRPGQKLYLAPDERIRLW